MTETTPQIVVVGSHAPGLFVRVQRVPLAGETVIGWDFQEPMDSFLIWFRDQSEI